MHCPSGFRYFIKLIKTMTKKIQGESMPEVDALKGVSSELEQSVNNIIEGILQNSINNITDDQKAYLLDNLRVGVTDTYEDVDYLLYQKNVRFLPKKGVVAIKAKAKNGKTFLCSILASSLMGCNDFGIGSYKPSAKVLFIDTEQRKSSTQRILKRINVLTSNDPNHNNENLTAINVRAYLPNQRKAILQALAPDFDLVIVDGVVDLTNDYNSLTECQTIIAELIRLAEESDICIVCVLHTAKTSATEQMRGHLGTELLNKCEACYQVEKKGQIYEVKATEERDEPIEGFAFVIDEYGIPRNANDIQQELKQTKEDLKIQKEEANLREIFRNLIKYEEDETGIRNSDLQRRFIEHAYGAKATYFKKRDRALELGVLVTKEKDLYFYSNNLLKC